MSTKNRKLTFKPYEMNQIMLLPPSLNELVPKRKATCLSHDSCYLVSKGAEKVHIAWGLLYIPHNLARLATVALGSGAVRLLLPVSPHRNVDRRAVPNVLLGQPRPSSSVAKIKKS